MLASLTSFFHFLLNFQYILYFQQCQVCTLVHVNAQWNTCGQSINSILKNNDIILIQEHWLFHSQINIISDICNKINFAAKGVDIRDPLLPISLPRGYGGVAVLWNMNIDHLIRLIPDGTEKIQCIELECFDRNMICFFFIFFFFSTAQYINTE